MLHTAPLSAVPTPVPSWDFKTHCQQTPAPESKAGDLTPGGVSGVSRGHGFVRGDSKPCVRSSSPHLWKQGPATEIWGKEGTHTHADTNKQTHTHT